MEEVVEMSAGSTIICVPATGGADSEADLQTGTCNEADGDSEEHMDAAASRSASARDH